MNLKFANISESGEVTMLLYKHLGFDDEMGYGINGSEFAYDILYLNENYTDKCKKINIRINSVGGSVHEGLSICSAILNSKIPVDIYIDGWAYSMAGVIAMCGRKVYMAEHATFMMHGVQGGSDKEVLDLLTKSLAVLFENRPTITKEKIKELMDVETWMDAEDCFKMGLVDEVIKTGVKVPQITNKMELYAFYNKLNTKKEVKTKKIKKMEKLTNLFKLSNEASEDAIFEKAKELKNENERLAKEAIELQNKLAALEAENEAFKNIEKEKEAAAKLEVVENAVKEGKIEESKKEEFVNTPMTSLQLKNLFGAMKTTPVHVKLPTPEIKNKLDERAKWTFKEWKEKDPKGLLELQNNAPEAFNELVKTINIEMKSKY